MDNLQSLSIEEKKWKETASRLNEKDYQILASLLMRLVDGNHKMIDLHVDHRYIKTGMLSGFTIL